MGGATYVSDAQANLTSDGARTYAYDLDNHLTGVSGAQALTLAYGPRGRLRQVTTGGTTTTWLWDGDRLVAEYDNAGQLAARTFKGRRGLILQGVINPPSSRRRPSASCRS